MKKILKIDDLRTCLAYDTEEKKFLSTSERCSLHKNQINILERSYPLALTPELKIKISLKLKEIKKRRWRRPEYRYEREQGVLKRIRTK